MRGLLRGTRPKACDQGRLDSRKPWEGLMNGDQVLCEWCEEPATWWVRGQWTIADWLDIDTCAEHLVKTHKYLALRTVDGQACLERTSHYLGPVPQADTRW